MNIKYKVIEPAFPADCTFPWELFSVVLMRECEGFRRNTDWHTACESVPNGQTIFRETKALWVLGKCLCQEWIMSILVTSQNKAAYSASKAALNGTVISTSNMQFGSDQGAWGSLRIAITPSPLLNLFCQWGNCLLLFIATFFGLNWLSETCKGLWH